MHTKAASLIHYPIMMPTQKRGFHRLIMMLDGMSKMMTQKYNAAVAHWVSKALLIFKSVVRPLMTEKLVLDLL